LINGKKDKAIEALNRMAKLNGSKVRFSTTDKFKEEIVAKPTVQNNSSEGFQEASPPSFFTNYPWVTFF